MRWWSVLFVVAVAVGACHGGDQASMVDAAAIDAADVDHLDCGSVAWCIDGTVYTENYLSGDPDCPPDGLTADPDRYLGRCSDGCAYPGVIECFEDGTPCPAGVVDDLCYAPPPAFACALDDTACASAGATEPCIHTDALCGDVVHGGCTCDGATWSCAPACADGLCGAAEVLAAMVGRWEGTVTPPAQGAPYAITLEIFEDARYHATCDGDCLAFPPGTDDDRPGKRIHVRGQTELGAYAEIIVVWDSGDERDGELTGIRIQGDALRFDYRAPSGGCDARSAIDLIRIAAP
jgi:hypothetical protein